MYQGNAVDILGPETGPTPVAVKVLLVITHYYMAACNIIVPIYCPPKASTNHISHIFLVWDKT